LNLPGNWPIAKIKFKIFDRNEIAPAFIPTDIKPMKIIPVQIDKEMEDKIHGRISRIGLGEMIYEEQ